jgi:signal transduction histidine kinase
LLAEAAAHPELEPWCRAVYVEELPVGFVMLADDVPPGIGQAAYRIVQEGLTNARKHAPGGRVALSLRRTEGSLQIVVDNPLVADSLDVPGTGRGLIGLRERVTLAGGTLTHGPARSGRFELRAELPWT